MVNAACGTTEFHIWNVEQVPDVDLRQLMVAMELEQEFGSHK